MLTASPQLNRKVIVVRGVCSWTDNSIKDVEENYSSLLWFCMATSHDYGGGYMKAIKLMQKLNNIDLML